MSSDCFDTFEEKKKSPEKSLFEYIVDNTDTITKIALKFNITIGEIKMINSLSSQMIYPGQKLYIPVQNELPSSHIGANSSCFSNSSFNSTETSSLFPSPHKPLQLYMPSDKAMNRPYEMVKSGGCVKLEASYIPFLDASKKTLVELILNPTCIRVKFDSVTSKENIKTQLLLNRLNRCSDGSLKNYNIPFKLIYGVKFFSSLESLFDGSPTGYCSQPIIAQFQNPDSGTATVEGSRFNVKKSFPIFGKKSGSKPKSRDKNIPTILCPTSSYDGSQKILSTHGFPTSSPSSKSASPSSKKKKRLEIFEKKRHRPSSAILDESAKDASEATIPQMDEIPIDNFSRNFVKKMINLKVGQTVSGFGNYSTLRSSSSQEEEETPLSYLSIEILNCSSVSSFRSPQEDIETEESSEKLFFEINSKHLNAFRDFVDQKIPKNVIPQSKLSLDRKDSENLIDFEKFTTEETLPVFNQTSEIIDKTLLSQLVYYLPRRYEFENLRLGYSTNVHGFSIKTLYRNMLKFNDGPSVLVIKDESERVFGAIISALPRISNSFYGCGECVLFTTYPSEEAHFFPWTQKNLFFMKGDQNYFAIGGGGSGHGLCINENMVNGYSLHCETFENEILSNKSDFKCLIVEVWVFGEQKL